ncbi:MAG: efflux RND transporter permease subunit, partial [Gammaproteobacteria bacterium]|nr:efflux RND transporter permease subunit [Gammaproteobacteria bacterium]
MERLISWWVRNPVASNLLLLGIVLAGVLGFTAMEREAYPIFRANQVQVEIAWPGAAPQEVEEQILIRIEEALYELRAVRVEDQEEFTKFADAYEAKYGSRP